jgi:transketolase
MRGQFFKLLEQQMQRQENTFFLCADMGLGLIENLQAQFPQRTYNIGIAEANMAGVAAGLCNTGFRPYCYTISNFLIERAFEQIRNDICLHDYPVVLIGTSTGFDNGILGPTHHVIDEIGCIKGLPSIQILSPVSIQAIPLIMTYVEQLTHPCYIRIGKGDFNPEVTMTALNQMVIARDNARTLVITHGTQFENCFKAVEQLTDCALYAMNLIHPLNHKELLPIFNQFANIIVVEDQLVSSGLYNSLCQWMVESRIKNVDLISRCIPVEYSHEVGHKDYFEQKYGLTTPQLLEFFQTF